MSDENELGQSKERQRSTDSQIRHTNSRLDDISELIETVITNVKVLTFRNLIVIIVLFSFLFTLFIGYVGFNWLLKPDNRSALINIAGQSRLVGFVDNCAVFKVPYGGEVVHAVFITYQNATGDTRYIVSLVPKYDTVKIRVKCADLYKDRQDLLRDRQDLEKAQIDPSKIN